MDFEGQGDGFESNSAWRQTRIEVSLRREWIAGIGSRHPLSATRDVPEIYKMTASSAQGAETGLLQLSQ